MRIGDGGHGGVPRFPRGATREETPEHVVCGWPPLRERPGRPIHLPIFRTIRGPTHVKPCVGPTGHRSADM